MKNETQTIFGGIKRKVIFLFLFLLSNTPLHAQMKLNKSVGAFVSTGLSRKPIKMKYLSPIVNFGVDLTFPIYPGYSSWSLGFEHGFYSYVSVPSTLNDIISQRKTFRSTSNMYIKLNIYIHAWDHFGIYVPLGFNAGIAWIHQNTWIYSDPNTGDVIDQDYQRYSNEFVAGLNIGIELLFKTERGNFWYVGPYAYFRTNDLFLGIDEEFIGINCGYRWSISR